MKQNKVQPIAEIDLNKVSVFELLCMIERGDKNAYYMLLSLKAAEARMIERARPVKYPSRVD